MFDEFSVFVFALSAPVSDDPDSPYDLYVCQLYL